MTLQPHQRQQTLRRTRLEEAGLGDEAEGLRQLCDIRDEHGPGS
ncbi:hypothetical protein V1J52_04410 [Streptomyces sp. TRM 70351]|nr:hypothetical protein [Streptomyces sp. TRM 70351]MEE1927433.1 hypothetical protein [Streptomyces sp. TRM 70351]